MTALVMICFVLFLIVIILVAKQKQAPNVSNNSLNVSKFNKNFIYKDLGEDFEGFGEIKRYIRNETLPFVTIKFNYVNSGGEKRERTIGVTKIFKLDDFEEDSFYVRGFCYLKVAYRTFKFNRMSNIEDVESGRIFKTIEEIKTL